MIKCCTASYITCAVYLVSKILLLPVTARGWFKTGRLPFMFGKFPQFILFFPQDWWLRHQNHRRLYTSCGSTRTDFLLKQQKQSWNSSLQTCSCRPGHNTVSLSSLKTAKGCPPGGRVLLSLACRYHWHLSGSCSLWPFHWLRGP